MISGPNGKKMFAAPDGGQKMSFDATVQQPIFQIILVFINDDGSVCHLLTYQTIHPRFLM
jgi:hypothetical protein